MRAAHQGFTLIEVLVALVIVAVGMAALMGALSSSANSVSYLREKTFAEWVALNQIATLRLQRPVGQVPPVANTEGDIDFAGRSWHWRQEVVATQVPNMVRIDVKVRPREVKAGDDAGWFVTVSGLAGDTIARGNTGSSWGSPNSLVPNGFGNQAQSAGGLNTGALGRGPAGSGLGAAPGMGSSGGLGQPSPTNTDPPSDSPVTTTPNPDGPNP